MLKYLSSALALFYCIFAHAEIYKHVDASGRVTYSNVKIPGGKKMDLEPADTNFGGPSASQRSYSPRKSNAKTDTPADFPNVDNKTQQARDSKRNEVLENELAAEKEALAKAKEAFKEGETNPEIVRTPTGQTFRNMPKFTAKMDALRKQVEAHERNIELLNRELNRK